MYKILPYPQEILRFISTGLNVRNNNKKLDNAIREEKIITEDDIESYYNISIVDEIKSLSIDFSYFVKISLKELFITYFNVVREISFLPLNDDQKIDALYITFNRVLESLFYSVNKKYKFNIKKIFNSSNEIETAILHIENKYLWFKNFSASLQKEEKDLIWRWKKGKNNPTLAKVKALREKSENKKSQDWDEIIAIILLSRLIKSLNDRFRSSDFSKFSKSLSISQDVVYILQQFEETDNIFNKKQTNETRLILEDFISKTIKSDNLGVKFFNYWAKARINLINCDLKKACLDYKLAFEIAKYNAGEVFIQFCHEALLVANLSSSEEPLYKRIYDFLIIMKEKTSIGKKYEYKWEKESSIIEFKNKFPYIKITKEIKDKINIASGEIKVDLRYPNKKINNNLVTRVKRQPQIFHFINNNDVNSVKLILDHEDFDVNKLSDSNDSALLLSLGLMSVVNFNDPNNDEIFKLISKKEHKKETMNKMTSKRMYTPLMFAIDTGRFDVVKRIVEMGADVNLHAETDLTSSSNHPS